MHRPSNRFAKNALYLAAAAFAVAALPLAVMAKVKPTVDLPPVFDIRLASNLQTGPVLRAVTTAQINALKILQGKVGTPLTVRYNGLTATPRHLFVQGGALTGPSLDAPEMIARRFLRENAGLYRFSEADLNGLRLRTRSTAPGMKTTIMVFEQQVNGVPVYQGDVLVNVNIAGEVLSVGNDNYPQLTVTNQRLISPAQAVTAAAAGVGVASYSPSSIGTRPVLRTYGELSPQFIQAQSFAADTHFTREIRVVPVVFPLGDTARQAWKFDLVDRAHMGIMWQNVVDAETGAVLSRISLTAFQQGGGVGKGRLSTFRPDMQDFVESKNAAMTAKGLVFDDQPTVLSGAGGFGRSTRSGTAPNYSYSAPFYGASTLAVGDDGYHFRYVLLTGRNKNSLPFADNNTAATAESFTQAALSGTLGQVLRGFPDAANPSASSPFGWFYLPTGPGGAEIATGNTDHTTTRAFGYTMTAEAKTRNKVFATNGPGTDGDQPYSATLTSLPGPVTLADGRVLSKVWQSSYTEGNNVLVADDRANDDETTLGVRGYSATREFTSPYFDFVGGYEYGVDATSSTAGGVTYPPGADVDVPSSDLSLFNINNLIHDYMYSIGFTEAMWNFQQDNFGKGGAGGDALRAQTMDGSGLDNANMGTPAEGDYPTMQMFLNTDGSGFERRSDSAYEWDTVAHEHYHGVSNRSAAKGDSGCLGLALLGEPGGEGEGWGDFFADSISEADNVFDYTSGVLDSGLRAMPSTNYRWSYGSINGQFVRRDSRTVTALPDGNSNTPFEVHQVGEIFTPMLWDMRELLIAKDPNGVFYDGTRRLGSGTAYYIGDRKVQSVDSAHPIDFRVGFKTTTNDVLGNIPNPQGVTGGGVVVSLDDKHAIRSNLIADEVKRLGNRQGPLATAVSNGGRLADTLVLTGLQLGLCNPTIVDTRDSILQADQQLNGGENRSLIWRAFASHGVGNLATSTGNPTGSATVDNPVTSTVPVIVEDFSVPTAVTTCETSGPLPSPGVSLAKSDTTVTLTLTPTTGANNFVISRSSSANGAYALLGTVAAPTTGTATYVDSNLTLNSTYYYRVRQARDAGGECVSQSKDADIKSITLGTTAINTAPIARLSTDKDGGVAPLSVAFEGITSSDPDNGDAVVSYSFDLDGDGTYEVVDATSSAASKTYSTAGTYVAKLKVKDKAGLESAVVTKTITVTAPNTPTTPPPVATGTPTGPAATAEGRFGGALGLPLLAGLLLLGRRRRVR